MNNSVNHPVSFYENTPDNTHCFQASIRMLLKYFFPDEEYSWEELERITAKVEGKWTWPMAGLIWLSKHGIEVRNIEIFDYQKFIDYKEKYLLEFYGPEVSREQIANSVISQEFEFAKKFIEEIKTEVRIPTQEDLQALLSQGYIITCGINSRVLNGKPGFSGHSVIVRGFDHEAFFLNDPGIPGIENRRVPFALFEKAWAYPDEKARNIAAFKKK